MLDIIIFYGGLVLLLAVCAGLQLWYATYRTKRQDRFAADGQQRMLDDSDPRDDYR